MGLQTLQIEHFRCLDSVEIQPDSAVNVFVGPNGSGKTSVLEAIYFIGRGRSFRAPRSTALIQTNCDAFTIFGNVTSGETSEKVGARVARGNTDVHVNGKVATTADLAAVLPVQVIEPEVHQLVQGGPEKRRQFIDWGVFHVKHEFLENWRRYRRTLKQRNAALRLHGSRETVTAWDHELIEAGLAVDGHRREFIEEFQPELETVSIGLSGQAARCEYWPGWPDGVSFQEALSRGWDRDKSLGSTQTGPHRAELNLTIDSQVARHRLSRGQQKLLGAALVLAQSQFVSVKSQKEVVMLVDEPAAELDEAHLQRLLSMLVESRLQLFLSALEPGALKLAADAKLFHVERGDLSTLL